MMRVLTVCVDYCDILRATFWHDRHHFTDAMIVTAPQDRTTIEWCKRESVRTHVTDAFYRNGAAFNKFLAMEEALDVFGRHGWMCLKDADTCWPYDVKFCECGCLKHGGRGMMHIVDCCSPQSGKICLVRDCIYTPRRRMMPMDEFARIGMPRDEEWIRYPIHPQCREWAGFTQIFHADDPALGPPPWHETNWAHAGGGDSIFQAKWPDEKKIRPPFEALHIGAAGLNWCGRVEEMANGFTPAEAKERVEKLARFIQGRRETRSFDGEKL